MTAPSDAYTPPRGLVRVVRAGRGGGQGGGRERRGREGGRDRVSFIMQTDTSQTHRDTHITQTHTSHRHTETHHTETPRHTCVGDVALNGTYGTRVD